MYLLNKSICKSVAKSIHTSYFIVLYFLLNIYRRFFPIENNILVEKHIVIDPIKKYIDDKKDRFITTDFNENTDKVFYSKKDYQELLENPDNYLEKKWKRNILLENTPRGNIIMYYDAFKQGFAYYCDSSSVAYDVLNAVAMKYVCVFHCKDFFIDQTAIKDCKDSPLIKIHLIEEKTKKEEKRDTNKFEGAPFAKFKNYNTAENKVAPNETTRPQQKIHNKFINLGKTINFKITQPIKKINKLDGFKSNVLDNLAGETQLQKEVMNYKNYKAFMSKL